MTGPGWDAIGRVAREARAHDLAIVAAHADADRAIAWADENARPRRDGTRHMGPDRGNGWHARITAMEQRARELDAVFAARAGELGAETMPERVERIVAEKRAARAA